MHLNPCHLTTWKQTLEDAIESFRYVPSAWLGNTWSTLPIGVLHQEALPVLDRHSLSTCPNILR